MRDPDRAWEYGSREIEREANADAYPPPGGYVCIECEGIFYFDEDGIGREVELEWEIPGLGSGISTGYLCPECAMIEMDLVGEETDHDRNPHLPRPRP